MPVSRRRPAARRPRSRRPRLPHRITRPDRRTDLTVRPLRPDGTGHRRDYPLFRRCRMPRWAAMSTRPAAPTSPNGATSSATARSGAGSRRGDASMTLLREVMEQPLDPSYRLAADRRAAGRPTPPRTRAVIVLVAVLCGWLVTQGVIELRRPEPDQAA